MPKREVASPLTSRRTVESLATNAVLIRKKCVKNWLKRDIVIQNSNLGCYQLAKNLAINVKLQVEILSMRIWHLIVFCFGSTGVSMIFLLFVLISMISFIFWRINFSIFTHCQSFLIQRAMYYCTLMVPWSFINMKILALEDIWNCRKFFKQETFGKRNFEEICKWYYFQYANYNSRWRWPGGEIWTTIKG